MPRASQMPRTRALLVLRRLVWLGAVVLVAMMGPIVGAAGDDWWLALLALLALGALIIWVTGALIRQIDKRYLAADVKDRAALPSSDRVLPYGVVSDGDRGLRLPPKRSMVVLIGSLAAGFVALGVAMTREAGGDIRVAGSFIVLLGLALGALAVGVTRVGILLTPDGIEAGMARRRFYRWIDVPEMKIDRNIVVLKSASARRPRVWIRTAMLQASLADCVGMIRRQRDW